MTRRINVAFFVVILAVIAAAAIARAAHAAPDPQETIAEPVDVYFFWGDGCPHCAEAEPFLGELAQRYPSVKIHSFEVWYDAENQAVFQEMAAAHGFEARYVPTFFIGDQSWQGFSLAIRDNIEAAVQDCVQNGCPDARTKTAPSQSLLPGSTPTVELCDDGSVCTGPEAPENADPSPSVLGSSDERASPPSDAALTLPLLGTIDLGGHSLWASTALISFVDGFNPCSLWVLSILIALTLRTGSRKRILTIGLIYITVTAAVYVLFIAGLFTFLTVVSFMSWIQMAVSVMALVFAAINIKDYFWYKEGVSLTISDEKKPGIYKRMRKVVDAGDSFWALAGATVALGAGVSFVEFSCTAGFPVIWTNLVAAQGVRPLTFALLLLLYMVIYQIDELLIFGVAVVTLRASRLEEKHGRMLKLVGGTLMLTLAAVMLIEPTLMGNLAISLLVFGTAIVIALLILLIHRRLLPKAGIYIGSEFSQ